MLFNVFVVFILVSEIKVTEVGPFLDYGSCSDLEKVITEDVTRSMQLDFPFGMVMDKWGIGNGAIYRLQDYDIACGISDTRVELPNITQD